jgi:beta-lactamase superfamily II metal-dependent hydrolase
MKVTIHDVGHGLCVSLVHQNGNVMVWDCGHTEDYRPSEFLPASGISKIDYFFVTNYDEDHISDLPDLRATVNVRSLFRNKSISSTQLRALKRQAGPITPAMESMLDMIDSYTGGPLNPAPEFPGVRFRTFSNNYGSQFPDTNNISLVTFLECGSTKFIIPGDLERPGWDGLLARQEFVDELAGVNVFIASHHGREGGYHEDVFRICSPHVIVFSDSEIRHATQEMSQRYAEHASGVRFDGETRYVLSTRNDGSLTWTI